MKWPNGKRAAFAIIDDTDDAELPEISEVYAHLIAAGLRTTKTVWVYPPRDLRYVRGDSLVGSADYTEFVRDLVQRGFEIGIHNVGSGGFTREETIEGIETFEKLLGFYPAIHVNHSYNKENIYSGDKRFGLPFRPVVRKLHSDYTGFEGDMPGSLYFWGDVHKKHIRWSRSLEVDRLNLLRLVNFPYKDRKFSDYCNAFFPSTFCPNQDIFARMVTEENIRKLIDEGGAAIIYTHFGYYHERGTLDEAFVKACDMLALHADDIWFAPVGEILDYLAQQNGIRQISLWARLRLEFECLVTRFKYRYIVPLDDFHYKKSIGMKHRADD